MKEEVNKVKEKDVVEDVKREDDKSTIGRKDVKGSEDIFEEFKELPYVKDE
jgi:hypothetical protein